MSVSTYFIMSFLGFLYFFMSLLVEFDFSITLLGF